MQLVAREEKYILGIIEREADKERVGEGSETPRDSAAAARFVSVISARRGRASRKIMPVQQVQVVQRTWWTGKVGPARLSCSRQHVSAWPWRLARPGGQRKQRNRETREREREARPAGACSNGERRGRRSPARQRRRQGFLRQVRAQRDPRQVRSNESCGFSCAPVLYLPRSVDMARQRGAL